MLVASPVAAALLGISLTTTGITPLLHLQDPALSESSGLAASSRHEDVLWTHADGGTRAEVKAVDGSGETVATVTLSGVDPYDPEAIAPGPDDQGRSALFLGDVGDNSRRRDDVSVFRFEEPARLGDQTVPATWFRFTYPDGPHDAEALLVHPDTGRIMIATKRFTGGGLYQAPEKLVTADQGTNELVRVADVPGWVTDGAYLPDGRFLLRTYAAAYLYDEPGHLLGQENLPLQPQGESMAVRDDMLLVGSEGERPPVFEVPVPQSTVTPEPTATPSPSSSASDPATSRPGAARDSSDSSGPNPAYVVAGLAAALLLALVLAATRRRHTRPR